jgi:tetratricopeptide (TPR) repeat protein
MIRDLRTILDGWDFEPGKISVRKIIGCDGREKIQTRIDLGVLQMDCAGRPDGLRPHNCESLLEYQEQRLRTCIAVSGSDEDFLLSPDECRDLRHEAYLYYQRYLSLYVLEEFDGVERDTTRNLRVIDLCDQYSAAARDRGLLRSQRAYVMMMNTRAKAQLALARGRVEAALSIVEHGISDLERQYVEEEEDDSWLREADTLRALRREVLERLPDDAPAKLQSELEWALATEDYEQAARLRDRLSGQ